MWFAGPGPQIHIKMKNLKSFAIPIATLALLFAGCSKDKEVGTAKVHVSVSDFAITQQDLPQTKTPQDAADYDDAKAIVLAFYNATATKSIKPLSTRPIPRPTPPSVSSNATSPSAATPWWP